MTSPTSRNDVFQVAADPERVAQLIGWEEAEAACSQFVDGGVIVCGALGSEWCDFECPLRRDLGLTPKEAQDRAITEITAEVQAEREAKGSAEYDSWFTFDGSDDIPNGQ